MICVNAGSSPPKTGANLDWGWYKQRWQSQMYDTKLGNEYRFGNTYDLKALLLRVADESLTAEAFYAAIGAKRYDEVFAMTLKGDALATLAGEGD